MSDEPSTTSATSSAWFGSARPGRTLAFLVLLVLFVPLLCWALASGSIGKPGPDPKVAIVGRAGFQDP